MPRAYTVATAALALGVSVKWVDNILSHHTVLGVRQEKQGIARRLSVEGLLVLALAARLIHELGLSSTKAILVAERMAKRAGRYVAGDGLRVEIDLEVFQARLLDRLENAVEIAPMPKRGRPLQTKTGRLD